MNRRLFILSAISSPLAGCAAGALPRDLAVLKEQVTATEVAFAKTMADRDHLAFSTFIADEAVFLNGGKPLRGKEAVVAHWKRFFAAPSAPFSWKPEFVELLPSGSLAQSVGPVANPDGVVFARFNSIWRLEAPDTWRIIFDEGSDVCRCPKT